MTIANAPSIRSGSVGQCDAENRGKDEHDHDLDQCPDAGGKRLAEDESRSRGRRDEQLGQHPGVALPDDLDAVEDGDEHARLGDDPRREEVQIGDVPGGDGMKAVERLPEDDEPQHRLDRAGDDLGAVVPELLQLDQAERDHPVRELLPDRRVRDDDGVSQRGLRCDESCGLHVCLASLRSPLRDCCRCSGGRRRPASRPGRARASGPPARPLPGCGRDA